MEEINKEEIFRLIKERRVKFVGGGYKHIISGEFDQSSLWETLDNGVLLKKEQLCEKLPNKASSYTYPYYFLHKLKKFLIIGKPVLLGFYIGENILKVGHFSGCSAEAKFYKQFKKES